MREPSPSTPKVTNLLYVHAESTAARALSYLGAPLRPDNLEIFLRDRAALRYVTSLRFDGAPPPVDRLAEPVLTGEGAAAHCCLHIQPRYQHHPEALPHIVAYMAAAIVYGEAADADLSEYLGAMLVHEPLPVFRGRMNVVVNMR